MAGTITQPDTVQEKDSLVEISLTCTADATDGSFPSTVIQFPINGFLMKVTTNPDDVTAPTNAYDITLTDQDDVDVMNGSLANRSNTTSEVAYPLDTDGNIMQGGVPVYNTLTINISNNSVNSAVIEVRLLIFKMR